MISTASAGQRGPDVLQETILVLTGNVLDHVERECAIEAARHRRSHDVMDAEIDRPAIGLSLVGIGDELRIKVNADDRLDSLRDQPGRKTVGAADFENALASGKHLGDKFVAGEREEQVAGVVMPGPGRGDTKTLDPPLADQLHPLDIMRFAVSSLHRHFSHPISPNAA